MLIKNNTLVLYKNKAALVVEISGDKYLIRTIAGDRKSVRLKDIEFLHSGPCSTIPQLLPLPDMDVQQEAAELIGSDRIDFREFMDLLLGSDSPAAALTAMEVLAENCCFSGSPSDGVQANPPEHIRSVIEREQQKNAARMARSELLERIRSGSVAEDDRVALREIENVAYAESSSSKLMQELNMEAAPDKAQSLLLKLGVWDYFQNNPWPRRFAVELDPEYPLMPDTLPQEARRDLTYLPAYAIDDIGSNDPDDAVSFDPATGWLWVHIADPAALIEPESELELFARSSGSTLYLPEKTVTMLPENAVPLFGLGLQDISPAISFALSIDNEGEVVLQEITLSQVKVTRMVYSQAEELMASDVFAPCVEAVQRFRNMREKKNAVMIRLPEVKIKVDIPRRDIAITPLTQSPARELVANAMLATGYAVAKFAMENNIVMPFAVQEDPEISDRPESIPGMYALRKSCRQSTLSTLPGRHAGLGLEPYCRVTSPLRRYEDLLGHMQLRKYLQGKELLSMEQMDTMLADSEPAAVLRGKLERQCREYWTLVMLHNHPSWQGEAIYVAKPDERSVWLLPELAYEFKNRYNARIPLGESVCVECIASDPAALSVQFKVIKTANSDSAES